MIGVRDEDQTRAARGCLTSKFQKEVAAAVAREADFALGGELLDVIQYSLLGIGGCWDGTDLAQDRGCGVGGFTLGAFARHSGNLLNKTHGWPPVGFCAGLDTRNPSILDTLRPCHTIADSPLCGAFAERSGP